MGFKQKFDLIWVKMSLSARNVYRIERYEIHPLGKIFFFFFFS